MAISLTGRSASRRARRQASQRIALIQRQSEERTFAREAPVLARLESSAENFIAIQRQRGALTTQQETDIRARASTAQGRVQANIADLPGTQVGGQQANRQRLQARRAGGLVQGSARDNGGLRLKVRGTGKDRGTISLVSRPTREKGESQAAFQRRSAPFAQAEATRGAAIAATEADIAARGEFADGASQRRLIESVNPGAISGPARQAGPTLSAKENLKARARQVAGVAGRRRLKSAKRKGLGLSVPGSKEFLG